MSVSIAFWRSAFVITVPEPGKSFTSSFVPMIVTDSTSVPSSAALILTTNEDITKKPMINNGEISSKNLFIN